MTALTTESRAALVSAFTGHGLKVYTSTPPVPVPPCVVIVPDSPWIQPERIGSNLNYKVRWRILVVISPRKNDAAQLNVEEAIDLLLPLVPNGFSWDLVNPPQLNDVGAQGTVYTTEINVSAHMKE